MAESGAGNSRGLEFAERLLQKHGWEHGKGLGRDENGISEAIKVKVKCDKGGVGHKPGEQFTFHWWDHVFNQTSARLEVQSEGGDTAVLQKNQTDEQTSVSNRKPLKASAAKDKLYGAFVKSATLVSGQERAVGGADGSSSSDDDDERLDLSSANKLSDAQLVKVCGGRTAHKGARHGLNMSAKLARLEQQEAEFMAKYGKKTQKQENGSEEENTEVKKKKKKKRKECEVVESGMINGETEATNGQTEERKQKKSKKIKECEVVETEAMNEPNEEVKLKKKMKKSKDCEVLEAGAMNGQTQEIKQKKKKSKDCEALENEMMNGQTQIKLKKKKKKSKDCEVLENEATNGQTEEIKQKKKKRKEEEIQGEEKDQDLPPQKKKKKKSKE